jgi:hypothetical protein
MVISVTPAARKLPSHCERLNASSRNCNPEPPEETWRTWLPLPGEPKGGVMTLAVDHPCVVPSSKVSTCPGVMPKLTEGAVNEIAAASSILEEGRFMTDIPGSKALVHRPLQGIHFNDEYTAEMRVVKSDSPRDSHASKMK